MADIDKNVQDDMTALRDANYMDYSYAEALLRRARDLPPGSRSRIAYLSAARDIIESDTLAGRMFGKDPSILQVFDQELG